MKPSARLSVRLSAALFLLLLTLAATGCYQGDSSETGGDGKYIGVSVGDKPAINFKTTDGHAITGESLRGHVVVLDFWASWCGPCMAEAPHMVALHDKFAPRGVEFIGVNFDNNAAAMEAAVRDQKMTWPQVMDGGGMDGAIGKTWGVQAIPQTVILSPDGVVIWAGHPAAVDKPLAAAVAAHPSK